MNENRGISPAWVIVGLVVAAWMMDIRPSVSFWQGSDRSEATIGVESQPSLPPVPQGGVSADIQALQAQIAEQQRLIEQQMQQAQVGSPFGGGGDQAGGGSPQAAESPLGGGGDQAGGGSPQAAESPFGGGGDQAGGGSPMVPLSAPIERDVSGNIAGIGDGADLNSSGIVVTTEKQSTDGVWFFGYGRIYAAPNSDTTTEACYTAYVEQGGGENPPAEPIGCDIQWEWHKK